MRCLIFALLLMPQPSMAETIFASRTIPAQSVLTFDDILLRDVTVPGGIANPFLVVGKETRVALFAGNPIRNSDVIEPAIIERNQIVTLVYEAGGVTIRTEGRALDRAAAGDVIRIMNLSSRNTVAAEIGGDGSAYVRVQ